MVVVVVVVVVVALGGCCGRGAPKATGVTLGREVVAVGDSAVAAAAMLGVLAVLHADAGADASAMAGAVVLMQMFLMKACRTSS